MTTTAPRINPRTLIRCNLNKYKTPLFSYDEKGIYVRCKDCRIQDKKTGEFRRGTYHLVPWSLLFSYMEKSSDKTSESFLEDLPDSIHEEFVEEREITGAVTNAAADNDNA